VRQERASSIGENGSPVDTIEERRAQLVLEEVETAVDLHGHQQSGCRTYEQCIGHIAPYAPIVINMRRERSGLGGHLIADRGWSA
jgi:hypothetical protein